MDQDSDFVAALRAQCCAAPGNLGFPDSDDPRILRVTARLLAEKSVAQVTLFSDEGAARRGADALKVALPNDPSKLVFAPEATLGARLDSAATRLNDGRLDAVVAGNLATTRDVIRAGISGVGLAPGCRTVSGSFLMYRRQEGARPAAVYLYADCGVVIYPTARQLVDIAQTSVETWKQLVPGVPPVVAFLSFSTKGSAKHELQERMAEAAAQFKALFPDVEADGELQFDAAFDGEIGAKKAPGSPVPGRANCFIFPSLDAGNIAYKITQRLGGFEAYGPILQGLAKPFSDLSRGSTDADILASAYVNLLRAAPRGARKA